MKILITGCSLSQLPKYAEKNLWFTFLLSLGLSPTDEVTWVEPSVTMSDEWLSQFDRVLVGVTPPLSATSRFMYGTLHVIERLWGDERLRFVVDARQPELITRGYNSFLRSKDALVKEFFISRFEYYDVENSARLRARLMMTAIRLTSSPWPPTIMPILPWMKVEDIAAKLPEKAYTGTNMTGIVPDAFIFDEAEKLYGDGWVAEAAAISSPLETRWLYESSTDYAWITGRNLYAHRKPLTSDYRHAGAIRTLVELDVASGFLTGPVRARKKSPGPLYWTPAVALALSHKSPTGEAPVPIFTDWQISQHFHYSFSALPATFEGFEGSLKKLGHEQKAAYRRYTPGAETLAKQIQDFVKEGIVL